MIEIIISWFLYVGFPALGFLMLVGGTFFIVRQQDVAIVERLGRFNRVKTAGLGIKLPFLERVAGEESLKIQQLDLKIDTKTKDNVFVTVKMSVMYRVLADKVYDAFYKLEDAEEQISAYVQDVVRSKIPKLELDTTFEEKDEVGKAVKESLDESMKDYGFEIPSALVVDISPASEVAAAMNNINAERRNQVAAEAKGEAARILEVKAAQADAEAKKLAGEGIANQRKAIIAGLQESVAQFQTAVAGSKPEDVMNLVLMTQYFDTLRALGGSKSTVIMVPHSPGALKDVMSQIRESVTQGEVIAEGAKS